MRAKIIDQVREACENWGFFQAVNHGIPASVLEEMIDGIRGFHEQDTQVKKEYFYKRDFKEKVSYFSNFDLCQATVATWKDCLSWAMAPSPPDPTELPAVCRYVLRLVLICETLHSDLMNLQRYSDGILEASKEVGVYFI